MDFLAAQPESYIKIGLLPMLDDDKVKNEIVFDWIQVKKSIDFTKFLTILIDFTENFFIFFYLIIGKGSKGRTWNDCFYWHPYARCDWEPNKW